jgi:hypothetical protein
LPTGLWLSPADAEPPTDLGVVDDDVVVGGVDVGVEIEGSEIV